MKAKGEDIVYSIRRRIVHMNNKKNNSYASDGDTSSLNITYSDESIREVDSYLTTKKAYVGTDGKFVASVDISTVQLVMYNLTGF